MRKPTTLIKFRKPTKVLINLKPIVRKGDRVIPGQVFLKDMLPKMENWH
jgi:hypothetical protein